MFVTDVNDASCLTPDQSSRLSSTGHKLIMLPDGLYVFSSDIYTYKIWIGSGITANTECCLRYGETAKKEMDRLHSNLNQPAIKGTGMAE